MNLIGPQSHRDRLATTRSTGQQPSRVRSRHVVRRESVAIGKVCEALEKEYGNPRHGNKANPLDELVYIILSTRTQERAYRATFARLKREFPTWNSVTGRKLRRLESILAPNGLGRLKARQLVQIFRRLSNTFGRATLAPLTRMTDEEAQEFLTSLPGVSAKVAKCVLMYSLRRPVLPVDAHVHRVASRLGVPAKKRPDTSQDLIERAVAPELRYGFHVNAIAHGRTLCRPVQPRCASCCIGRWCNYYQLTLEKDGYTR